MSEEIPEYVRAFTAKQPHLSRFAIERSILRTWKREWSQKKSPFGTTWTDHFMAFQALLTDRDPHPLSVRCAMSFEETVLKRGRKIINWIGSKSCSKTDNKATFAVEFMSIHPEKTKVFMAAPTMKAAESTCWGRTQTRFIQVRKKHGGGIAKNWYEERAKDRLIFHKDPEAGFIECRTIDKVGKLQGTKSVDQEEGWFILMCDEVALFQNTSLLDVLDNLTGNVNFFCITGCNFKDTEGMEGQLCKPEGRDYSDLDVDHDQEWLSDYDSMTWRFDGHRSPNVVAKKVIFPYLLTEEGRAKMEKQHGLRGPKYLEQIRSFPNTNASDKYVLTRDVIRSSGSEDDFYYATGGDWNKVAFMDPGLGGDPCRVGAYEWGSARVQDVNGDSHDSVVFQPCGAHETLMLESGKMIDADWIERMKALNPKVIAMAGQEATIENQIAVLFGEFLQKMGIKQRNASYDGSLRPRLAHEIASVLGTEATPIDSNNPATQRIADAHGNEAKDLYFNLNTEMVFAAATLVQSGQFRGAKLIQAAMIQICRRKWMFSGTRKKIEPKDEYKSNNNGRSPDDMDVFVGAVEKARRHGLQLVKQRVPIGHSSDQAIFDQIRKSAKFGKRIGAKRLV